MYYADFFWKVSLGENYSEEQNKNKACVYSQEKNNFTVTPIWKECFNVCKTHWLI